jgi:hypothetical protein
MENGSRADRCRDFKSWREGSVKWEWEMQDEVSSRHPPLVTDDSLETSRGDTFFRRSSGVRCQLEKSLFLICITFGTNLDYGGGDRL